MFIVNVEAAIYKDDEWLIIERSKQEEHAAGLLSLVGGKVEQEGNALDVLEKTIKREIYEEVGIMVKEQITYIYSTSFITDLGKNVVDVVFLCEYESGNPFPKSKKEVENVYWMTTKQIISHSNAPHYLIESIKRAEQRR